MSNQQKAYLKAMGIDVWVERLPSASEVTNLSAEQVSTITQRVTPVIETQVVSATPVSTESVDITKETIPEPQTTINVDTLDWQALYSLVCECENCDLSKNRTKTLFGAGNQTASLMIIGDAPNENDEQQATPYTGEAGQLLTAMLKAMGYQRNDVYISNLVKCRTAENQDPSVEDVAACEPYLLRQIKLLQPDLILALGVVAAQRLLKSKSTLGRLRGQLHYIDGINVPVIVSFDPAYLLRSPNEKRKAWEDLQMAMKRLAEVGGVNV